MVLEHCPQRHLASEQQTVQPANSGSNIQLIMPGRFENVPA